MPNPPRIGLTREEKLAALPPYKGISHAPAVATRLDRLGDTAMETLSNLDTSLEELQDEFSARFEQDDARNASRSRIMTAAQTNRDKRRR